MITSKNYVFILLLYAFDSSAPPHSPCIIMPKLVDYTGILACQPFFSSTLKSHLVFSCNFWKTMSKDFSTLLLFLFLLRLVGLTLCFLQNQCRMVAHFLTDHHHCLMAMPMLYKTKLFPDLFPKLE